MTALDKWLMNEEAKIVQDNSRVTLRMEHPISNEIVYTKLSYIPDASEGVRGLIHSILGWIRVELFHFLSEC